ncbi:MAG: hypothetical protein BJ554DRAFT_7798, partial [Olpidium bornovanus]
MPDGGVPADQQNQIEAELDRHVRSKRLVELHTHLLGMGSADFWVNRIMETYLPRVCVDQTWERAALEQHLKTLLISQLEADRTSIRDSVERLVDDLAANRVDLKNSGGYLFKLDQPLRDQLGEQEGRKLKWFLATYTNDVVYSDDALFLLFDLQNKFRSGRDDNPSPPPRKRQRTLSDESRAATLEFHLGSTPMRPFIIFNARRREFQLVRGVTNSDLVRLMQAAGGGGDDGDDSPETIRAAVRNGFSMLSKDGNAPSRPDLNTYKQAFTPEFYPKRFRMKDCIYQQRLEVLSILLNNAIARYDKAGVRYAEFSLSANDLLNVDVCKHLVKQVFTEPSTPLRISTKSGKQSRAPDPAKGRPVVGPQTEQKADAAAADAADAPVADAADAPVADAVGAAVSGNKTAQTTPEDNPRSSIRYNALRPRLNLKPAWARVLGMYLPKPRSFLYGFLAAFNRGGVYKEPGHRLQTPWQAIGFLNEEQGRRARELCSRASTPSESDRKVERAFPAIFDKGALLERIRTEVLDEGGSLHPIWKDYVVGLDWVGDEFGFPYCAFVHSGFIGPGGVVWSMRRFQKRFGIRVHCGESLPLPPSVPNPASCAQIAFETHLSIVLDGLERIHDGIGRNLRVGHGVAFLHRSSEMAQRARAMITSKGIICELNMTSNLHLVLSPNSEDVAGLTVRQFLDAKMPVVLGTDDDGI